MKKRLLRRPSLSLLPLIANFVDNACLAWGGFLSITDSFLFFAVQGLFLAIIYAGLKTGTTRMRFSRYSLKKDPKGYWRTILLYFVFYLLVSIGFTIAAIQRTESGIR